MRAQGKSLMLQQNRKFQDVCVSIVQSGDLKSLQNLLADKGKKEINAPIGDFGFTLLHLCAIFDQVEIAAWLLENKAKVDKKESVSGKAPLHIAAYLGCLDMIKLLLKHTTASPIDEARCLPIHYACMQNNLEVVRFLIKKGENPNIFSDIGTLLDVAIRKKNLPLADFLSSNIGLSCLTSVNLSDIYHDDVEFRIRGCISPLHFAMASNQKEITEMLCYKFPQFPGETLKDKWCEIEDAIRFFALPNRKKLPELFYPPEEIPEALERINRWLNNQKSKFLEQGTSSNLLQAVLQGNLHQIKEIVQQRGASILTTECSGYTPLELADDLCFLPLFDWLMETKTFSDQIPAPVSFFSRWCLMEASKSAGGFFRLIPKEVEVLTLRYHIMQDGDTK